MEAWIISDILMFLILGYVMLQVSKNNLWRQCISKLNWLALVTQSWKQRIQEKNFQGVNPKCDIEKILSWTYQSVEIFTQLQNMLFRCDHILVFIFLNKICHQMICYADLLQMYGADPSEEIIVAIDQLLAFVSNTLNRTKFRPE